MKAFIVKVFVLAGILSILLFFIFGQRILIPVGILLGALLSTHKTRIYKKLLSALGQENGKSKLILLVGSLYSALPFLVLLVAAIVDKWLFMGVTIGLLTTSTVIIITVITDQIGWTHSNWTEWF